jgi:hypothetical protein
MKEINVLSIELLSLKNIYIKKSKQIIVRDTIMLKLGINNPKLVPLLKANIILNPVKTSIFESCGKKANTLNLVA